MSGEQTITRARANLLQQLHAVHPIALTASELRTGLALEGYVLDLSLVQSQLVSLEETGFVKSHKDAMNQTRVRYARTEQARVYLVDQGLITD